ncbi:MAG: DNA replication/repair protein RecF [Anderseniella sp.]|nr:DNA replication/repair protein RecF [Anderseniella sp.]
MAFTPKLQLTSLTLTGFRNHAATRVGPSSGLIALCGHNGAGKTNVLEAISLLMPGRGLRGAPYEDLAPAGRVQAAWAVSATVENDGLETRLGTAWQLREPAADPAMPASAREVRIDGQVQRSAGALAGHLRMLWLTPAMDRLFAGPASDRRRYLDRLTAVFDGGHGSRVNALERLLRERNRLLAEDRPQARWLDSVEAQLAEAAVAVAAARSNAMAIVAGFVEQAREGRRESAFPWAEVTVSGELEQQLNERPAVQIEDEYRTLLADSRGLDRAAGRTLRGPHRSDLLVVHGPRAMEARLCSTGEQKALLLGLVLAQARAVRDTFDGAAPLLLLDEVAAHLDAVRRAALMDELLELGSQTWMTGTDRHLFEAASSGIEIFEVADGQVTLSVRPERETA